MLKEQLHEIKKSRKTLLHTRKSLISFIPDQIIDNSTLLSMINIKSDYITQRSLHFERNSLSEKEEYKFNVKFSKFLKSLITEMETPGIEYCLEYLTRIYLIDTYNTNETILLLFPFKKYFEQLKILCKNSENSFASSKIYSTKSIAKYFLKDVRNFNNFVEYFKYYDKLSVFLDKTMDHVVEILKNSRDDYLSEIYQIFVNLIENGHSKKALMIYHRIKSYLDNDSFVKILLPFFTEDEIDMVEHDDKIIDEYQKIFNNKSGRSLLKNEFKLIEYLRYLKKNMLVPSEFSDAEYLCLENVFCNKNYNCQNIFDIEKLYSEITPEIKLTKALINHSNLDILYKYMEIEDKLYLLNHSQVSVVELLNEDNYNILLKNISQEKWKKDMHLILDRCLGFQSFDPKIFLYYGFNDISDIIKRSFDNFVKCRNIVKLANMYNYPLQNYLTQEYVANRVFLSYLLNCKDGISKNIGVECINSVMKIKSPSLVTESCDFINNFKDTIFDEIQIIEFVMWAYNEGFAKNAQTLVEYNIEIIDVAILYEYALETANENILQKLIMLAPEVINNIYDDKRYDLILKISEIFSVKTVLIDHKNTLDWIKKSYDNILDKYTVTCYVFDNADEKSILEYAMIAYDTLMDYRLHTKWPILKIIIIETLFDKKIHMHFLNEIIKNIEIFIDDSDLFKAVLSGNVELNKSTILELVNRGESAISLINEAVKLEVFDIFPTIPLIAPKLILHQKDSVELLYKNFGNIMCSYTKMMIENFIDRIDLLFLIDPRYVLIDLINHFSNDNFDICFNLIVQILKTKVSTSMELINKMSLIMQEKRFRSIISVEGTNIYKLFIEFYIRSFRNISNTNVENFIDWICSEDNVCFQDIMVDTIDKNSSIYSIAFANAISNINCSESANLLFIIKYLSHRPNDLSCDSLKLVENIFYMKHEYSADCIAAICRSCDNILTDVNEFIKNKINNEEDVEYCLRTLTTLFKTVEKYRGNRNSMVSIASELAESKNEVVAKQAQILYESLQFLS